MFVCIAITALHCCTLVHCIIAILLHFACALIHFTHNMMCIDCIAFATFFKRMTELSLQTLHGEPRPICREDLYLLHFLLQPMPPFVSGTILPIE